MRVAIIFAVLSLPVLAAGVVIGSGAHLVARALGWVA